MNWNIVADSGSDLITGELNTDLINFEVVPLKIIIGDKEFIDDSNLDIDELLEAMKNEKTAASSACPSPGDFLECFKKADCSICVTITGQLSGTYNSAMIAKDMLTEEYPEKKAHIVNSGATAGSLVLISREAKRLIESGLSFEEIVPLIDEFAANNEFVFSLSNYDNLVKNGRMSPLSGVVASMLRIRAIAVAQDGEIKVVNKARGEAKTIHDIIRQMTKRGADKAKSAVITQCKNIEGANKMKAAIEEAFGITDITIYECRGLCTFYSMDGAILVSFS